LQKWLGKNISAEKITKRTRLSKKPENFVTTLTEMNGKYGWFESSFKSYNLPEYYTGLEFTTKKLHDNYLGKKREIQDLQRTIF
jgi:hypothetical protein